MYYNIEKYEVQNDNGTIFHYLNDRLRFFEENTDIAIFNHKYCNWSTCLLDIDSNIEFYVKYINKKRFIRRLTKKGFSYKKANIIFCQKYWPAISAQVIIPAPQIRE